MDGWCFVKNSGYITRETGAHRCERAIAAIDNFSRGQFEYLQSQTALLHAPGIALGGFIGGFPLFLLPILSLCFVLLGADFPRGTLSPLVGAL